MPTASDPLLTLAFVTCAAAVVEFVSLVGLARWYVPHLPIRFVRPRLAEVAHLYRFGIQSFFVLFAFRLISYTDTTVIGLTLGASSVALYAVPLQLVEYGRLSVGGFSGVFLPRLTQLSARDDIERLRREYVSATRVTCFLAGWIGALVIALGPFFLGLWIEPAFGVQARGILIFLTIGAFASAISTQAPFPFYQALHLVARPAVILSLEGALNLALSVWLAFQLGIVGVALATAIPAALVTMMLLPGFLCRRLELPLATFLSASILPGVAMLGVTLLLELGLVHLFEPHSYFLLGLDTMASAPVAALLIRVGFPANDRRFLLEIVRLRRRESPEPA